jgi:hypothetical protein
MLAFMLCYMHKILKPMEPPSNGRGINNISFSMHYYDLISIRGNLVGLIELTKILYEKINFFNI